VIIERAVGARSSLTRVAAQAGAVGTALGGVHVGAILAVFDGDVPGGAIVHDGVTIAIADVPTMDVIVDAPTRMGRIEIARYAALATARLRPLSVTASTHTGTLDTIPAWQSSTPPIAPTKSRRRWWLAVPALAIVVAGAYVLRPTATVTPPTVTYECRHPGTGWTEVLTWSDASAAHDGVEPGERTRIRVHDGVDIEAEAPATPC
jgi:hypothetical protein